jgi:hypothetical protein
MKKHAYLECQYRSMAENDASAAGDVPIPIGTRERKSVALAKDNGLGGVVQAKQFQQARDVEGGVIICNHIPRVIGLGREAVYDEVGFAAMALQDKAGSNQAEIMKQRISRGASRGFHTDSVFGMPLASVGMTLSATSLI